jgi:16S rRNA processing protein RimM
MNLYHEPPEDSLHIGRLGKTFGLKGGLHFYGLSPAEDALITSLPKVFVVSLGCRQVLKTQPKGKRTVVFLERVEHIKYASPLVNQDVYAYLEDIPEDDATHYTDALLGLATYLDGELLGEVVEVLAAGSQDLLVIATAEGDEHMLPRQADYVDVTADGVYVSNPPEGLFELDS